MKVASFDIGIRNLAFCILEGKNHDIKLWKLIDLKKKYQHKCNAILKSGKRKGQECGKKAKRQLKKDLAKYFCLSHIPKKDSIRKYKKLRNGPKKMTIQDTCLELVKCLDTYPELLQVDRVLIENQPKKSRLRNVMNQIYSYFIIRGMIDPEEPQIKKVLFISAHNKLKVYRGPFVKCDHLKRKYDRTKYLGVKYCQYMIKDNKERLEFLNSHKKKDDLADSFLQGAYYLKKFS